MQVHVLALRFAHDSRPSLCRTILGFVSGLQRRRKSVTTVAAKATSVAISSHLSRWAGLYLDHQTQLCSASLCRDRPATGGRKVDFRGLDRSARPPIARNIVPKRRRVSVYSPANDGKQRVGGLVPQHFLTRHIACSWVRLIGPTTHKIPTPKCSPDCAIGVCVPIIGAGRTAGWMTGDMLRNRAPVRITWRTCTRVRARESDNCSQKAEDSQETSTHKASREAPSISIFPRL